MHRFIGSDKFGIKIKSQKYFGDSKTDLFISDSFKEAKSCASFFGFAYQLPKGMEYDLKRAQSYLAGSHQFAIKRMEIFDVNFGNWTLEQLMQNDWFFNSLY